MSQKELRMIFISEIKKYTSACDFMNKKNKSEKDIFARRLFYSMLHIMKTCSNIPYSRFEKNDRFRMINSIIYSKKYHDYRKEVIIMADIIDNRIRNLMMVKNK